MSELEKTNRTLSRLDEAVLLGDDKTFWEIQLHNARTARGRTEGWYAEHADSVLTDDQRAEYEAVLRQLDELEAHALVRLRFLGID
jgi:hypothetical protein